MNFHIKPMLLFLNKHSVY